MMDVFSRFGPLQSVELSERSGASGASGSGVSRYFTSRHRQVTPSHPENTPLIISSTDRPVRTGIRKWIQQYSDSLIKASSLQQDIDQFMNDYDTQKEEVRRTHTHTLAHMHSLTHTHALKANHPSVSDIAELRKKFEEDKQRIAVLRAQRKFRPY
ncbi:ribosomal RNA-processing protein 7 homolog A-like [Sinocyclocheilus grahami]|uniref:ribosomal RNA-processing protein 7 homolog A-like n=1 Tax=Sinocyclocheilus grahami TaxID=75366 RepID=UPI0007AD2B9C|nr:PREDICTED: ribosomal RNA-processing protein 7 homolog A-like [Sinocyclocheilus grahami]